MSTAKRKPPVKGGRELWLQTVKDGTGNMTGGKKRPTSAKSTSDLTHLVNAFRTSSSADPGGRSGPSPRGDSLPRQQGGRKPTYKTPEEYYDEIIELKRQIVTLKGDNDSYKSKFRRVEEDCAKKEKQLEQLLDPSKDMELRRTLADKKVDSSMVIQSLKQKIFKLEQQVKEKETEFGKLQTDLKSTKIEELRLQNEVLFNEVHRLRDVSTAQREETSAVHTGPGGRPPAPPGGPGRGESASKVDNLSKTVRRLTEEKTKLMADNKTLRQDLDRAMLASQQTKKPHPSPVVASVTEDTGEGTKEYEDMNRKDMLRTIAQLNKKINLLESQKKPDYGLQENHLDDESMQKKSSADLLIEIQTRDSTIARLQEDKRRLITENQEKSNEIRDLEEAIIQLKRDLDNHQSGGGLPNGIQKKPSPAPRRTSSRNNSVSDRSSVRQGPRPEEVEAFREQHAAKVIQKGWREHHEDEENVEMLQSALRGHLGRQKQKSHKEPAKSKGSRRVSNSDSIVPRKVKQNMSQRHDPEDDDADIVFG